MKKIILLIVITACAFAASSQRFRINNAIQAGGQGWDIVTGLILLPEGKIAVSGSFTESIGFGSDTLFPQGSRDAFIAIYNSDGSFLNVAHMGGTGYDYITNLGTYENGILSTLWFNSETGFGKERFRGYSKENCLAMLCDYNLNLKDYNQISSTSLFEISGLSQNVNGKIQFSGWFSDTLFMDGKTYYADMGSDIMRGTMTTADNQATFKHYLNVGSDRLYATESTKTGCSFMTGISKYGGIEGERLPALISDSLVYLFISELTTDGMLDNITYPLCGYSFEPVDILQDSSSLYVLINFRHSLFIDEIEIPSKGMSDVLLLKIDLDEGKTHYSQIGGYGFEEATGMVRINSGLFIAGKFTGRLSLGGKSIEKEGFGPGIFLAGFNEGCAPTEILNIPVVGSAFPCAIVADNENLYIAGQFRGTIQSGSSDIVSVGDDDIFVLCVENCLPQEPVTIKHNVLSGSTKIEAWELDAGAGFESYFWDENKSTSRFLTVYDPGTYTVTVSDKNGCVRTGEIFLADTKSARIESDNAKDLPFSLFPTVTSGIVYWEPASTWENKDVMLRIFDSSGKTCFAQKYKSLSWQTQQLDISHLPEASYYVEFLGNGIRETIKVIVKK